MKKLLLTAFTCGILLATAETTALNFNFWGSNVEFTTNLPSLEIQNNSDGKLAITLKSTGSVMTSSINIGQSTNYTTNCPATLTIKKVSGKGNGKPVLLDLNCKRSIIEIVTDDKAAEGFKVDVQEIEEKETK